MLSDYELKVAEILERKLKERGIDVESDSFTDKEMGELEELTKEAQDEAKK